MFQITSVKDKPSIYRSGYGDLYQYNVYIGKQKIDRLSTKNSYWFISDGRAQCYTPRVEGAESLDVDLFCVEIFGYTPEDRSSCFDKGTDLPYVNGCSTKQLIPAARPGDPTFQYLLIPAGCSEQEHHIHATPRVVYVYKGEGVSIVGMGTNQEAYKLTEGDLIVLDKMVPHHFETKDQDLVVLPIHIFSSGPSEFNHPMFNGTHKV